MKPTPRISPSQHASRSFPLTNYSFQATAETQTSSSADLPATKSPAFHKLSSEFFGTEMSRDYVTQFLLFTVIGGNLSMANYFDAPCRDSSAQELLRILGWI